MTLRSQFEGSLQGAYPAEDIRVGDNDPQVNVDWRHEPTLELEAAKLHSLQHA